MDGLLDAFKEIEPFVTILGFAVTIYLLVWRIPSRADMNRLFDNIQTRLEKEMSSPREQVGKAFATTLAITNDIREDLRLMQSQIVGLGEKIDANSQTFHADMSKLTDKIEANSQALRAEIQNRAD